MPDRATTVWLLLCVLLVLWRLAVPTHIDMSATSLHKDIAHIFWGCLVTFAIMRRDGFLFAVAIGVAAFEAVMAIPGL